MAKVDETAFIKASGATFKLGIEFVNWHTGNDRYFHPFGRYGDDFGSAPFHQHWLRARHLGDTTPLADYSLANVAAHAGKFRPPETNDKSVYSTLGVPIISMRCAMARYLRVAGRGTRGRAPRREDHRRHARRRKRAISSSVQLEDGGELAGDLFIDCTGQRALLIGDALGVEYQDWSQLPPLQPGAGRAEVKWISRRPIRAPRRTAPAGNGAFRCSTAWAMAMVYCDALLGRGCGARTLLRQPRGQSAGRSPAVRFRHRAAQKLLEKNCVAIGLSAGFLEPLESTSIHLIQTRHHPAARLLSDPLVRAAGDRRIQPPHD